MPPKKKGSKKKVTWFDEDIEELEVPDLPAKYRKEIKKDTKKKKKESSKKIQQRASPKKSRPSKEITIPPPGQGRRPVSAESPKKSPAKIQEIPLSPLPSSPSPAQGGGSAQARPFDIEESAWAWQDEDIPPPPPPDSPKKKSSKKYPKKISDANDEEEEDDIDIEDLSAAFGALDLGPKEASPKKGPKKGPKNPPMSTTRQINALVSDLLLMSGTGAVDKANKKKAKDANYWDNVYDRVKTLAPPKKSAYLIPLLEERLKKKGETPDSLGERIRLLKGRIYDAKKGEKKGKDNSKPIHVARRYIYLLESVLAAWCVEPGNSFLENYYVAKKRLENEYHRIRMKGIRNSGTSARNQAVQKQIQWDRARYDRLKRRFPTLPQAKRFGRIKNKRLKQLMLESISAVNQAYNRENCLK